MTTNQLPLAFLFIIHAFIGNANASTKEEGAGPEIPLHISYTGHRCIRGLGYVQMGTYDGSSFQDLEIMNVHTLPRKKGEPFTPLEKNPLINAYDPRNYKPRTYEKTCKLSPSYFIDGSTLCLSFFMEKVHFNSRRGITMIPWEGVENLPFLDLGQVPMERDGLSLSHLTLDIVWETVERATFDFTMSYH